MKPLYLRFESEQSAREALLANGFELTEDGQLYHHKCNIDIVGVISGKPILDDFLEVIGNEPDLPGYHINLLVPDDYIPPESALVINVKTPVRKWSGY